MSDPLVRVPVEKWSELKSVLDKDWPRCVQAAILDIHRDWTEKGIKHEFEVFCPFGDFNNGMVSINNKISFYEVTVLCPSDDISPMVEALKKTKALDWTKTIEVSFCPENIMNCIKRLLEDETVKIASITKLKMFMRPKGSPIYDIRMPEGLRFGFLTKDHIERINDVWPHKYENSTTYFDFLIGVNFGYGLYDKNELLGWALIRENGCLLHFYVLKEHRRKGYGGLILQLISNEILKCNKDVFAYSLDGNESANKMYQKASFGNYGVVHFCSLKRVI